MENDRTSENTGMENQNFHHRKEIRKDHLINKLNYIHFQDETILFNFKHLKYNQTLSVKAKPQPCKGDELHCIWPESEAWKTDRLAAYVFSEIKITNGKNMLIFQPEDIRITKSGVHIMLPETCMEVDQRRLRRYPCDGINAQLIQNSVSFKGCLINFNADSFRVEISENPQQRFFWINSSFQATLILSESHNMFYAGECKILQHTTGRKTRNYILEPSNDPGRRLKQKEFRSLRQQLIPSPNIEFTHPFTKKRMNLKISDLSGSGFSVEEQKENSLLIPGIILPELDIDFAGTFKATCKTQVIYRTDDFEAGKKETVKCGFAILDMDIEDHGKLLALLYQAKDSKSFFCNPVDLDDLWSFFFETGFIYPEKYAFIQENKEKIKGTYGKIYSEPLKIAKHFIYQDKGRILGHMAMLRFYVNSWMIHHHAANSTFSTIAGIDVLDQIGRFIHESHRIFSSRLDYVFCYYRPENKFPSRVFGGITESIANPRMCSLDTFAYFHYKKPAGIQEGLKEPWHLMSVQKEDLVELVYAYEARSGGLMLNALELLPDSEKTEELVEEYNRLGFKREKHLFTLKKGNALKAVVLLNIADIGLNLSDLTNGIHVFVVDPDGFSKEVLDSALWHFSFQFQNHNMPVLLHPRSYADEMSVNYEKTYTLWVVEVEQSDPYFTYLKKYIKRVSHLQSCGRP
jgi:hypothetical protein